MTTMTPTEAITALEKALEAGPTPGPWQGLGSDGQYDNSKNSWSCYDEEAVHSSAAPITLENGVIVAFAVASSDSHYTELKSVDAIAAFIAAANPLAIRTLLDAHAGALRDAERYRTLKYAPTELIQDLIVAAPGRWDDIADAARAALATNTKAQP